MLLDKEKYVKNIIIKYTVLGIIFGLIFPIFSTIIQSYVTYNIISVSMMGKLQLQTPLLWVIDTAPLWLGIISYMTGVRQEKLNKSFDMMNNMNSEMKEEILLRKTIEYNLREYNRVLKEDIETAQKLQESFLPEVQKHQNFIVSYKYLPMETVGGDFLSLSYGEDSVGMFIADISGHGVSAALYTSIVKMSSDRAIKHNNSNPGMVLEELNREMFYTITDDNYLTALYGFFKVESSSVTFSFSRAAHPHPIIYNSKDMTCQMPQIEGVPICFTSSYIYSNQSVTLKKGDRVFFYTDGIIEATNHENIQFGVDRLMDVITNAGKDYLSVHDTVDFIFMKVNDYIDGAIMDDRLLICIEVV